jgi:GT2 family glycosyltransferase
MSADSFELRRLLAPLVPRRFRRGCFAEPPFLGYLDRPSWRGNLLVVRGWIVSRGTPIHSLHLDARGRELFLITGLERPDIAEVLPVEPGAAHSGFGVEANIPRDVRSIEVWATLQGGRRVLAFRTHLDLPQAQPEPPGVTVMPVLGASLYASSRDATAAAWPDLERLIASHSARVIVELDATSPQSRAIAAAQRMAPEAVVYLVGPGLGPPDHRPRVCVLDATPEEAILHFTDGTVDLILARDPVPVGWEAKLRAGGTILQGRGGWSVQLPRSDDPVVSIVIPVHGKIELTRRCLASLAAHPSSLGFEVIVVDDASPDDSAAQLSQYEDVRLISLESNVGFGQACNRGADAARGQFLVFLNNDTEVTDGWLDALHGTFVVEPTAGLVGAKLIFPDGTLHEAGSLIFRDGSAMNYGRGDAPDHPAYNMLRDVDYCSAACVMVRTELFRRLSGFDPRYSPAYYEDGDLAFRIRELGLRVLYQPFAAVIHHEGGTSGTDLGRGPKRFQVVNQEKFKERWHATLARYPARPPNARTVDANRRGGRRVLVVDHGIPRPDRDSGSVRMDHLLTLLERADFQVTFYAEDVDSAGAYAARLQRRGIEVLYPPWVRSLRSHLAEHGRRYDLAILSRRDPTDRHLAAVRELAPRAFVAFDTVDLHFVREILAAELQGDPAALALARQRQARELALMRKSDVTVVVSAAEAQLLAREHGISDTVVISNLHEVVTTVPSFSARRDLVFVGYFAHAPNTDGILWFAREVLPLVRARLPGVCLHVIGAEPPHALAQLRSDTLQVHGLVADLERHLDAARVMIAPLRFGAGVKGKITQSLSRGLPVVATTVAVDGMEVCSGTHVLVADAPTAFADALERLYRDEHVWTQLSLAGRELARRLYSIDAAAAGVEDLVHRLSIRRERHHDVNPLSR